MRILWYTESDSFSKEQCDYLRTQGYDVRWMKVVSSQTLGRFSRIKVRTQLLRQYLLGHDLIICDFLGGSARMLQKVLKTLPRRPKIIGRVHRYELYSPLIREIDPSFFSHIVAVSRWVKDRFLVVNPKFKEDQVTVIYNGIDHRRFKAPPNKSINNAFVTVGGISHIKGYYDLIENWPDDISLEIVGPVKEEAYYQLIRDLISRRKMVSVKLRGPIPNEKLPTMLADRTFYVNSSIIESFGVSIVEAMACGLIPLVRDWPAAKEIVPMDYIFNSFEEMRMKIHQFTKLDNEAILRRRDELRRIVESNFTLDMQMKRLLELIRSVSEMNLA